MYLLFATSVALVFTLGGLSASAQKPRRQPNRPPAIDSFISSKTGIQICPFYPSSYYGKPEVDLSVIATDPDGDTLQYEYSASEGIISGQGRLVLWNLDRVPRGPHAVRVTVTDGKGGKASASLTVLTMDAGICDRPPPPCPKVDVTVSVIGNP